MPGPGKPRIALLADIHGNLAALEAVLADLARRGPVVETVVLGDISAFGPQPREVLERVSRLALCQMVAGESERYLRHSGGWHPGSSPAGSPGEPGAACTPPPGSAAALLGDAAQVARALAWCAGELGPRGREWLAFLPPVYHRRLAGKTLRCGHGAPEAPGRPLVPELPLAELSVLLDDVPGEFLACGGSHRQASWEALGRRFVDPGSVGLPLDGDRRAAYALLSLDGEVELVRVAYPWEAAAGELARRRPPGWERLVALLEAARLT